MTVKPLKPCPFCSEVPAWYLDDDTFVIHSNNQCPCGDEIVSAKRWNRRAMPPAVRAAVEEMKSRKSEDTNVTVHVFMYQWIEALAGDYSDE